MKGRESLKSEMGMLNNQKGNLDNLFEIRWKGIKNKQQTIKWIKLNSLYISCFVVLKASERTQISLQQRNGTTCHEQLSLCVCCCCWADNNDVMSFAGLGTASLGRSGTGTASPVLFSPLKSRLALRDEEATLMILASFGEGKTNACVKTLLLHCFSHFKCVGSKSKVLFRSS